MKVEIDTEILKILGITADDFVYLYLLHANAYDILSELNLKPNEEDLQSVGLIKLGEKTEDHTVRQMFLDMFQSSFDSMWSELLSHFPLKVSSKGSLRILRARDSNAKANLKAKQKYKSIVGTDKTKHDRIVKCLDNELAFRKQADSLGFMKMLQTWVNSYEWENYEDINGEAETTATSVRRITRKL